MRFEVLKTIIKSEFIKLKNIKEIPQTFCLRDFYGSLSSVGVTQFHSVAITSFFISKWVYTFSVSVIASECSTIFLIIG